MADFPFQSMCSALVAISMAISLMVFLKQPTPYLDEVFHIPQAQEFCKHEFSRWDPKITTLPGLYFSSLAILEPLAVVLKQNLVVICSPFWLRITNVLFLLGIVVFLRLLLLKLHVDEKGRSTETKESKKNNYKPRDEEAKCSLTAIILSAFPLLYFYTFLYYTDPGSTFWVLLMYYFSINNWHFVAAVNGCVAIIFRQTNIVWVVFTAGSAATRILAPMIQERSPNSGSIISAFADLVSATSGKFKDLLGTLWSYALTALGFLVFVYINNGIVVGDRSSHEACLNFPQVFYLLGFTLFFSCSHLISPSLVLNFLKDIKNILIKPIKLLVTVLAVLLMLLLIYKFTYVHKYLLADNRHYPFYVWRKLYARHWAVRYALMPVYLYSGWAVHHLLAARQHFLWQLVFVVCATTVTVPQKLLEFRYFIVPYIMYRLHIPLASYPKLLLEGAIYVAVNAATLYLFLEKPFHWPHEPEEVQRFMW